MHHAMRELIDTYNADNYVVPDSPFTRDLMPPACHRKFCSSPQQEEQFDALIAKIMDDRLKEAGLKAILIMAVNYASCKKKNLCSYEMVVTRRDEERLDPTTRLNQKDVRTAVHVNMRKGLESPLSGRVGRRRRHSTPPVASSSSQANYHTQRTNSSQAEHEERRIATVGRRRRYSTPTVASSSSQANQHRRRTNSSQDANQHQKGKQKQN